MRNTPGSRLRKNTLFWLFALSVAVAVPAQAGGWAKCVTLFRALLAPERGADDRSQLHLPRIVQENSARWREWLTHRPEELTGLTTEQALELLHDFSKERLWGKAATTLTNPTWGNQTHIYSAENQRVVIKDTQQRSAFTGERVVTFHNDVRYEVLAFALDRYLGTNLVPPAIMVKPGRVALLYIPARATNIAEVASDPSRLMQASHLRLLDLLLSNGDRGAPKSVLLAREGQVVGIDFDLSKLNEYYFGWGHPVDTLHDEVVVEPQKWIGRTGRFPGVFSKTVVERLRALDRGTLIRIAHDAGLSLTEYEIQSVLGSRGHVLHSLELWKSRYGEALVVIPSIVKPLDPREKLRD